MIPAPQEPLFLSVKIAPGDTRLFPVEAGLSFLRLLGLGVLRKDAYQSLEPSYQVRFVHKADLENEEINKLLGLEGSTP